MAKKTIKKENPMNIDDYVLANRYELPIPEGVTQEELDDIQSMLIAFRQERKEK